MKKNLSIFFAALLLIAILVGCSRNGGTDTETNGASGERGPLYIEGSEDITLTVWMSANSTLLQYYTDYSEHPYFVWAKEQTGLNVEFIHPPWDQMEMQLNLMLASRDFYDMHVDESHPGGPQMAITEGVIIDLLPYLDDYLPDYKKALYDEDGSFADWEWGPEKSLYNPQPQGGFTLPMFTANGELWAVSQIWTNAIDPSIGPVIRKDWLDEAGLAIPETLDELEVALEAFKQRGSNVIPMNVQISNPWDGAIASAFDIRPGWWNVEANKTVVQPYAYMMPQFKDYLMLMNKWFEAGYIDPDFPNRDHDELFSMFVTDRLGVFFATWNSLSDFSVNYMGDQNFEPAAMPLPRMTKDQHLNWLTFESSVPYLYTAITTSCEYPEIAAQWLNVGFTREGILKGNYGTEGETYELRDGVPYFTEYFFNMQEEDYDFWRNVESPYTGYWSYRGRTLLRNSINDPNELSEVTAQQLVWGQNASPTYNIPFVVFEGDGYGEMISLFNQASTYADPIVYGYVMGNRDWADFDDFVRTAGEMGYNEAREKMQAALNAMSGR